eukprot:322368_1
MSFYRFHRWDYTMFFNHMIFQPVFTFVRFPTLFTHERAFIGMCELMDFKLTSCFERFITQLTLERTFVSTVLFQQASIFKGFRAHITLENTFIRVNRMDELMCF